MQEWAVVFPAATLFFSGVEFYKFCKRAYFRRRAKKSGENDAETDMFARYLSAESRDTSEKGEKEKV